MRVRSGDARTPPLRFRESLDRETVVNLTPGLPDVAHAR